METLITVLITLMVVALIGAGINLVRLNKKAGELENDNLKQQGRTCMIELTIGYHQPIEDLIIKKIKLTNQKKRSKIIWLFAKNFLY